jgi:hypothetical protein
MSLNPSVRSSSRITLRRLLLVYAALLVPVGIFAARMQPYQMDGDSMAYMDIADLLRTHQWAGVVNAYWHPLYPATLALAQRLLHPTRWTELGAYLWVNAAIFFACVAAMLWFAAALVRLRTRMQPSEDQSPNGVPLLSKEALQLLGVALVVIGAQRELSPGFVKPDALLEACMLAGFAAMLEVLAAGTTTSFLAWSPLVGLCFGLAYLTKSFAFLIALLTIAMMMAFAWLVQRRPLVRVLSSGALAGVVFALIAGPYIAALSHQKHRFDFGDSGALNYAWYVSGTDKMHLEPWMTGDFGSADVHLVHPEQQLLTHPGIYSYKAEPYGTYPDWFDPTYFNDRIVPRFNLARLMHRDKRNLVLIVRYVFNHPEAWLLFALLMIMGARLRAGSLHTGSLRTGSLLRESFWLPMLSLGLAMWGIYSLVNVEERYVTLAYLAVVLPLFAMLRVREDAGDAAAKRNIAAMMIALLAFLALGETLRTALDNRRTLKPLPAPWYSPQIYGAAHGLAALGVAPGDAIACMGEAACLHDPYWQRLAGVRVLTEVYNPADDHLIEQLAGLPNRQQVYDVVRAQGAKVLVARFDPGEMDTAQQPAAIGWIRLGETNDYALPLNLTPHPLPAVRSAPWTPKMEVAP